MSYIQPRFNAAAIAFLVFVLLLDDNIELLYFLRFFIDEKYDGSSQDAEVLSTLYPFLPLYNNSPSLFWKL
jgi:hypothetical protein